jgi:uncharacterized membrane protein (DUF106 family)
MSWVNRILAAVTDVAMSPFSALPAMAGLTVVSLVTAVAMLLVFKRTSNQVRLTAVKRSIHAGLFEIRLYNDDFRAIARAQAEILRDNAKYLWLSVVPMVWVIVPLVLVIAQLQFHYGYAPLRAGEDVLLKVQLRRGTGEAVSLEAPPELRLQTPAVWLPAANEVVWLVRPAQAGRYDMRVSVGAEHHTKSIQVDGGVVRRSPVRLERTLLNQLLYPSEPPLPDGGAVSAITVAYEEQDVAMFGWEFNWMVWYFALSLLFAFVLKKPFGVTI